MQMELLTTGRYREYLFDAVRRAKASIWLAAAYITMPGIEPMLDLLGARTVRSKCLRGGIPAISCLGHQTLKYMKS